MSYHVWPRLAASFTLPIAIIAFCAPLSADPPKPFLHPLFTDNMVLQRGIADPIWGWTTPGQSVIVAFEGKTVKAIAGPDGKWRAKIGPFPAGGPYTLAVTGPQAVTLKNVMVGDVWLCSGQSNMEFGVGNLAQPDPIISSANEPNLRLFTVPKNLALSPQETASGQWQTCTPDTIKSQGTWNGFSAVGYFFGRELQQNTHVPIGLLLSSWGGTVAEAWTSEAALKKNVPDFTPQLTQLDEARVTTSDQGQRVAEWFTKNDPGTPAHWQDPAFSDAGWKTMALPKFIQDAGDPDIGKNNGVVWFRRTFNLPAGDAGKDAVLHLLADDNETTWVNGKQVGATDGYAVPRAYAVPAALLKPTGNVIAVRLLDTGGVGGLYGDPASLAVTFDGGTTLPLAGSWAYRLGVTLANATAYPASIQDNANYPSVLYNGLISPLTTFGIKGAIWYQGESNAGRDRQYRTLLPAMIADWRQRWGEGSFPFLIVQLAGWQPGDGAWPLLRQAQLFTAQTVPNTGIAAAIDIGDRTDIHPKDKQDVGHRLALVAEAKVYGEKVPYSGPVYQSMVVTGSAATLTFTHADGGLISKTGPALTEFEISGADGKFVPADAHISGSTVVVSSAAVPAPTAVRYAWSGFPSCSLYNGVKLPAFPFDTSGK